MFKEIEYPQISRIKKNIRLKPSPKGYNRVGGREP